MELSLGSNCCCKHFPDTNINSFNTQALFYPHFTDEETEAGKFNVPPKTRQSESEKWVSNSSTGLFHTSEWCVHCIKVPGLEGWWC